MSHAGTDKQTRIQQLLLRGEPAHPGEESPPIDLGPPVVILSQRFLNTEQAALQNQLCRRRLPITLQAGGLALQARLNPVRQLTDHALWLDLRVNEHPAQIGMSWGDARRLVGIPLEAAAPADAALLMEAAMADWLDDLETRTGLAIRLLALSETPWDIPAVQFGLQAELSRFDATDPIQLNLSLALSVGASHALVPVLARWQAPRPHPLPLFLRVGVEVDTIRLSQAELSSLRIGDALVLPDLPLSGAVVIESQLAAPAQPGGDGPLPLSWTLTGPFAPRSPLSPFSGYRLNTYMPEEKSQTPPAEPGNPASDSAPSAEAQNLPPPPIDSLNALELRISFRLGETLMTVADLRQAGPGTIISLDRPDGSLIDILANGQLIGTGEVISVGGQRAVEISTLFGEN